MRQVTAGIAWLTPDLAFTASCVTLLYCLFLFHGYTALFRDSDAGWHIRTGETILATGKLPESDPYSFTRAGQPWFAWEWLADVAAGAVHKTAGLTGVALFYASAIAAGVWLWFRLHWILDGNFLLACAMAPLMLSTCAIHWLARPHVLGWLFLLIAVMYVERGGRNLLAIAAFTALWANVHASFFLAPLLLSRTGLWPVLAAAIAPLANPYGWRLYAHVFRYLTDTELLSRIGEFQSFDFHTPGSWQIIATLILGMTGGALAITLGRFRHFILAAIVTALALRSARALPLAALLLLPVANSAITEVAARASRFDAFLAYSRRLRAIDARFSGLALIPAVLLVCFFLLRLPAIAQATGFPPDQFPVAAYAHIPPDARLFAPDKFGGYLIYRSAGTRKVFFDGRSDFYGADFLKQYSRMVQVRSGWQAIWEKFAFTHALLPNDYPLVGALQQLGWHTLYRDSTAILLART